MKKRFFLHPFLFALYPLFFLYAQNLGEFKVSVLFIPTILVLTFAAIVSIITKFIFKKIEISSIVASTFIILTMSYNRILDPKKASYILGSLNINRELIFALILIVGVGIVTFLTLRYKNNLVSANKLLTIASLVLVFFSLFSIVSFEVKTGRLWTKPTPPKEVSKPKTINNISNKPDIYYLVFDRYAGEKSLREEYNFDNSKIIEFLKKKGFYVASESTTNYPKTFLSLASSLNLEYLNFLTEQNNNGVSSDESVVNPLIQDNPVVKTLKDQGYSYVHLGSWWSPTASNKNADINFIYERPGYLGADEFTTGFLNTTIAGPILREMFRNPIDVSMDPQNNDHRQRMFYEFNSMKSVPEIKGPKFVFMHVLAPHDPFVVDKNCKPLPESEVNKNDHVKNYLGQLECVNKNMETMIDDILKTSKNPPIIIVQADEGPFPMNYPLPPKQSWSTANEKSWDEKFPILNAYYLPGIETDALYQTITPVNSFRIVFNEYFNTNYPLLPDINYIFKDENNYYKFIDITQNLK